MIKHRRSFHGIRGELEATQDEGDDMYGVDGCHESDRMVAKSANRNETVILYAKHCKA